jgi:hypothetical protein
LLGQLWQVPPEQIWLAVQQVVPAPVPHVVPVAQEQIPPWQVVPLGQTMPQPPQLLLSVLVFAQVPPQPLVAPQRVVLLGQVHCPPEHVAVAAHVQLQVPQLVVVFSAVQVP